MTEQMKIFNVQFGDCFLCESPTNGAAMLVDFGSTRTINHDVACEVNSSIRQYAEKYLMISHFHNDHCCGIRNLDDDIVFEEVYLPNFFSREVIRLELIILAVLSESNPSYNTAFNLLSVVPGLCKHLRSGSRICYVQRREQINNDVDSYRVLWPDSNIKHDAENLYNEIIGYYNLQDNQGEIEQLAGSYTEMFPRFESLNGNNVMFCNERVLAQLREVSNSIEGFKNRVIALFREGLNHQRRIGAELNKRISSFQNNICICFDSVKNESATRGPVLFLSDIDPESFQNIMSGTGAFNVYGAYKAIKVAHHGTKNYYVDNLPHSEYLIISNGRTGSNGWGITPLYGWRYSGSRMICTNYNNACDYELSSRKCDAYCVPGCTHGGVNCNNCNMGRGVCGIDISYILQL